jgi:hypothetical protein
MSNKIKTLLGRRVYLEMPPQKDKKIIVDENTKEALQKSILENLKSLKVFAVGASVDSNIKVGDRVLVSPAALSGQHTVIIPLKDDKGTEMFVVLVQDHDIIHIWK